MGIVNSESGTRVDEIADRIYRISTPSTVVPGGFTFNQFLVVDEAPLLFHTGLVKLFPLVRAAVAHVLGDPSRLRYVSFSHFEADECGSLNDWLTLAPRAEAVCSGTAAMVSVNDVAIRPARIMTDGEELSLGSRVVRWIDTPHLPHGWESGLLFEPGTRTLFCGDLFTAGGADVRPLDEADPLGPALAMQKAVPYLVQGPHVRPLLTKLARTEPRVLGLMHGSAYQGDGGRALRALADAVGG